MTRREPVRKIYLQHDTERRAERERDLAHDKATEEEAHECSHRDLHVTASKSPEPAMYG